MAERGRTDTCWPLVAKAGKRPLSAGRLQRVSAALCPQRFLSKDKFVSKLRRRAPGF